MADSGGSSSGAGEKTIVLVSSDKARFEVREAAALLSQTVRRRMIDDEARRRGNNNASGGGGGIPLPRIDGRTLSKVLVYCNKHAPGPAPAAGPASSSSSSAAAAKADADPPPASCNGEEDLESFDREFIHVDKGTVCDLMVAADYLKIQGLLDLACEAFADMIEGKTAEQIRETFRIENDFTPEEEDEVRRVFEVFSAFFPDDRE